MPKLHVLFKKEELDRERLPGKTVVVLDVLFATSSIVTVLARGASEVLPLLDGAAARDEAARRSPGSFVLAGELNAVTLEGFCHPTPLALLREEIAGRALLYCTTNGTVALGKARDAAHVYAAALLNASAVAEHVHRTEPDDTVLIVCSGSADRFNLEDFYGAGCLVSRFVALDPGRYELSDAAQSALLLHERYDAYECLSQSRVGRATLALGARDELEFASRKDAFDLVPRFVDGVLRRV